jgi:hypothetical protein
MTIALCKMFRISLCQLTEQRSVVGELCGKLRKGEGRNERKEGSKKEGRKKEKIKK